MIRVSLPDDELFSRVAIRCPDCGAVTVEPDAFNGDKPVSGVCPECGERLYFEEQS